MTVIGTDGRGEPKLAGETAVCGKWKGAFAMRLQQSQFGLHCSTVSRRFFVWRGGSLRSEQFFGGEGCDLCHL